MFKSSLRRLSMESLRKDLFQRIIYSPDAFFKHQKIGDSDLSSIDRSEILADCFANKKDIFIQRYEKFITSKECPLFDEAADSASSFILDRIRNRNVKKDRRNIRNRRYMAMQDIKKKSDYFSDEKMREREPYLYDVMIGRFLGEEDQKNLRPTVTHELEWGWSGMIEQFEASQEIADRRRVQKTEYEGVHDANPSHARISRLFAHINNKDDSDDEMDLDDIKEELEQISREDAEALGDELEGNRYQMRQEFEAYMMERFLAGRDGAFFDYKPIDGNDRLDDFDQIRERDEEERWFDED